MEVNLNSFSSIFEILSIYYLGYAGSEDFRKYFGFPEFLHNKINVFFEQARWVKKIKSINHGKAEKVSKHIVTFKELLKEADDIQIDYDSCKSLQPIFFYFSIHTFYVIIISAYDFDRVYEYIYKLNCISLIAFILGFILIWATRFDIINEKRLRILLAYLAIVFVIHFIPSEIFHKLHFATIADEKMYKYCIQIGCLISTFCPLILVFISEVIFLLKVFILRIKYRIALSNTNVILLEDEADGRDEIFTDNNGNENEAI